MAFPSIQNLLEAGVHFGHQTRRWNPKMKKFIFAERNGIHIIDLKKTRDHLQRAADKVRDIASEGGTILFVGTKKQLKAIIKDEAERCGMFYVNERWLGGMMTNFQTIKKNIRRLRELERMRDEGEFELRTKKEALSLSRELDKLKKVLEGIKMMGGVPAAMFVVDAQKEKIAVAEANKLDIPLVALIDTNADPDKISFPVAGNDDAIRSVKVVTEAIADAILEGKSAHEEKMAERKAREEERQKTEEAAPAAEKKEEAQKRPRPRKRQRKKKAVDGARAGAGKSDQAGGAKPAAESGAAKAKAGEKKKSEPAAKKSEGKKEEAAGKKESAKKSKPASAKKASGAKKSTSPAAKKDSGASKEKATDKKPAPKKASGGGAKQDKPKKEEKKAGDSAGEKKESAS